jgi:hypothetical protein
MKTQLAPTARKQQQPNLKARLQSRLPSHVDVEKVLSANTLITGGQELANWQAVTQALWSILKEGNQ